MRRKIHPQDLARNPQPAAAGFCCPLQRNRQGRRDMRKTKRGPFAHRAHTERCRGAACLSPDCQKACPAESFGGKKSVKGNHPPRRQNCKRKCYNILFCNSGSSLAKKARRGFFDKLGSGQPGPAHCCRSEQAVDKTGKAKGLSLRGGRRPTWQSRAGNYDFADSFPTIRPGTARLPRAQSALAMTILEASRHRIHVPHAAGLHGAH